MKGVAGHVTPLRTVQEAACAAGITPNQVRLWERRFGLFSPHRAENGYRLYDEDDVLLMGHLRRSADEGHSVSRLAALGRERLLKEARRTRRAAPASLSARSRGTRPPAVPVTPPPSLIDVLRAGDGAAFERGLDAAARGSDYVTAALTAELPLLSAIGELSMKGTIPIAAEHLASEIIRRRILTYTMRLGEPATAERPVLLAGAPGDHHEIGLLAARLVLAALRLPVLHLGVHLPVEEMRQAATAARARSVLVSVTAPLEAQNARELASSLAARFVEAPAALRIPAAVGGFEALRHRALFARSGLDVIGHLGLVSSWKGLRMPGESR